MSNNTNDLINDLTDDLECTKPCRHPIALMGLWLLAAIIYCAAIIYYFGIRADIMTKLTHPIFLLEMTLATSICLSAGAAAFYLRIPDCRGAGWLTAIPLSFIAIFTSWIIIRFIGEDAQLPERIDWMHCTIDSSLFISIPLALMIFLTTIRSATTKPVTMVIMQSFAAGALGYICLRLTCNMDAMGDSLIYHIMPFVVIGAVTGLIARRFYKW